MTGFRGFPYILFVLLLLIDQPANFAVIHNAGRPEPTEHELLITYVERTAANLNGFRAPGKKQVILIGSSRSMVLGEVRRHEAATDPHLDAEGKALLSQYYFDPLLAFPGANLMVELIVVDTLVRSGARPDLVVVELGPEYLNDVLVESQYNQNIYEPDFMLRHWTAFPREMALDSAVRIAFPSYRYKFRPEAAILGRFSSDFEERRGLMLAILAAKTSFASAGKDVIDFPGAEQRTNPEFVAQLGAIEQSLMPLRSRHHLDGLLADMLGMLKRSGIPVVVWLPPVSSQFREKVYQGFSKQLDPDAFQKAVRDSGLPVADSAAFTEKCDRWEDAVHHSRRCNGLIALSILESAGMH